jgi:hypothetical protein
MTTSTAQPEKRVGLLNTLLGGHHEDDSPELMHAVDWAVDRVDPILRQMGGYPARYRKPVAHALDYAHALAARIPGPVSITPESHSSDPLVHAMFPLRDDLYVAMENSRAMRDFFQAYPETSEVYALICMRRINKAMFGMEMEGDILRRDVPQEAIYFTDYTIAEPGLNEAEARQRIARGFFESLVIHVQNRIQIRKLEKVALENERDELLARLHGGEANRRAEVEQELQSVLERLAEHVAGLELRRYPDDFDAVLLEPEKHLFIEQAGINLDSMGIVRRPDTSGSNEFIFCDLIGRDRRRWTVTLMYCNQVKNRASITDRLEHAQHWLGL